MGTHRLYAALRHPIALPNAFTPHKFLSLFVRTILSHIFMSSFGKLNQSPLPPSPLRSVPQGYRHNGWCSRCGWHSLKGKENTYFCNGIILAVLLSMSGIVAPICLDFQPNLLFLRTFGAMSRQLTRIVGNLPCFQLAPFCLVFVMSSYRKRSKPCYKRIIMSEFS